METKLIEIKAAITAIFMALGAFLGWKGIMAVVWVAAMILDYVSGSFAAVKAGEWSSKVAREGIWHKCGMILVVMVSCIADGVMSVIMLNLPDIGVKWRALVFPTVLAWYIITEFGSVMENAVKMGAEVPEWLVKMLKVSFAEVGEKKMQ